MASFFLHQTTEALYSAVNLVFTSYKPKTHDLLQLNADMKKMDLRLTRVFTLRTHKQENLFKLLNRAYTEARYTKGFKIEREQLEYLARKITDLKRIVKKVCLEEIEKMTGSEKK